MEIKVTFTGWQPHRDFDTDRLICWFDFSVVDSSTVGTARERTTNHSLTVTMTHELLANWGLDTPSGSGVSENMLKVAFQLAEEHITEQIKTGNPLERELSPLALNTRNSPESCPYKISNIVYAAKTEFIVTWDNRLIDADVLEIHPNIRILISRMDDALNRNDLAGVLHSSASIFETMAKDVVGIPTIQDQTLKSFFDRYRKDSSLPKEILDYIIGVYDLRNTTPLAGHGSIQEPELKQETAILLAEMTRAFIRIEYQLRPKRP